MTEPSIGRARITRLCMGTLSAPTYPLPSAPLPAPCIARPGGGHVLEKQHMLTIAGVIVSA